MIVAVPVCWQTVAVDALPVDLGGSLPVGLPAGGRRQRRPGRMGGRAGGVRRRAGPGVVEAPLRPGTRRDDRRVLPGGGAHSLQHDAAGDGRRGGCGDGGTGGYRLLPGGGDDD